MAISERYIQEYNYLDGETIGMCAPDCRRIIEELSLAEEQLAEQKRMYEEMKQCFNEYGHQSQATIAARDREIAELRGAHPEVVRAAKQFKAIVAEAKQTADEQMRLAIEKVSIMTDWKE